MCLLVKSILVNEHLLIERSSSHRNNGTLLSNWLNPRDLGVILEVTHVMSRMARVQFGGGGLQWRGGSKRDRGR